MSLVCQVHTHTLVYLYNFARLKMEGEGVISRAVSQEAVAVGLNVLITLGLVVKVVHVLWGSRGSDGGGCGGALQGGRFCSLGGALSAVLLLHRSLILSYLQPMSLLKTIELLNMVN